MPMMPVATARLMINHRLLVTTIRHAERAVERADHATRDAADNAADHRTQRTRRLRADSRTTLRAARNALSLRRKRHGKSHQHARSQHQTSFQGNLHF